MSAFDANQEPAKTLFEEQLIRDLREAFDPSDLIAGSSSIPGGIPPSMGGSGSSPELSELLTERRFSEYEIVDEIGRGGMGIVYRARQPSLDREVALKVLPGAASRVGRSVRRFRTEARAVARLNHPNIVPIFAQGEFNAHYYYAMALIEGCSLDVAIHQKPELLSSSSFHCRSSLTIAYPTRPGRKPIAESVTVTSDHDTFVVPRKTPEDFRHLARLMADVADGLDHAHRQGVVHRDIKPHNLILSADGRVFVTDFGLSLLMDEPHQTLSGEVMGTPAYLSPEQIRGQDGVIDHRTDIYSLGVTLYELLTGRRPFVGDTREQIITRICNSEPAQLRRIDRRIPADLETICLRAIDKDSARRYPTSALMAEDLRRYADGRPILSRRRGVLSRSSRWMRRHKAATGAMITMFATAIVTAGYVSNITSTREAEADRLLQAAYDQLVYSDYRTPDLVRDQIEQAEALGADPGRLNLVRAIVDLGASNNAGAIERLGTVLADQPDHAAAHYLLSWAEWRANKRQDARRTFDRAESLGGLRNADELFFRGLAAHFDRPAIAIESYNLANAARAAEHQFFPQAILHLARAYNQRMYAERTTEVYEDAEGILLQLIRQQHYEAFPYYLLSITQRLTGDALEASADQNEHAKADDYFRTALDWARLGQSRYPNDDRPITAEAECLEQMGLFADAIEARTRAIAAANQAPKRCEGHHYRWRLHYWLDELDAALQDIRVHATCMPESIFYARVYPALVYAEMGDVERASAEARAIGQEAPEDAQAVMWSSVCLRLLGHADEADQLLLDSAERVSFSTGLVPPQTEEWIANLFAYDSGQSELQALLAFADAADEPRKLRAEGYFHAAAKALGVGRRDEAMQRLTESYRCFDGELRYTFHARTLLVKLENDPSWPPWISIFGPTTLVP